MRNRIAGVRRHKGFSHEAFHRRKDQRIVKVVSCRNRTGRFKRKTPCEYGQPAQNGPLKLLQQVIAPVNEAAQCLLAWECGSAAACQQPEPIVEAIESRRARSAGFDATLLAWRRANAVAALDFLDTIAPAESRQP